ncbi:MAG: DMT family transporter [Oceanicaulis sp.]
MDLLTLLPPIAALGSAMAHSGMALFTKRAVDTLVFRSVTIVFGALLLSPILLTNPIPTAEVWPFLLGGVVMIWAFNMFMITAFRAGDMNLVYPVMRGAAPGLAAIGAWIVFSESLGVLDALGLAVASAALIAFAWPDRGRAPKAKAVGFALAAASMTALYTVVDAGGARLASSPFVYAAWHFAISSIALTVTAVIRRGPSRYLTAARAGWRGALACASLAAVSYTLILWAYAHAEIAPMAALRETSIVFGAILAALILKEPFGARRAVLAAVLAGGLAALQLG